jgi:flagellar hook-associated protein 2
MGTVGLNFGSPTSGTGFDVSSTVSQIVSNLQQVETPWKTQLSTLQSQDTQLSNLGTLLSSLSTDVGNLTDFAGVLAQKTGSSSNTNVLQLTAATSAAAAGTHSVIVNSLASTSSGYLTQVADAGDTLTGSVWLGVGNGSLHQISVPSGGNLNSLASAINSAGIGITASVLTDSAGSRLSLVSNTSGAEGNIVIGAETNLSDTSGTVLSYSGTAGSGNSYSGGSMASVAAPTDTLTGSMTIQVGSGKTQTVSLGSAGGTLADLANAINNTSGIGVTATISSDGTTLSLQSATPGSTGTIAVKSEVVDTNATSLAYASTVSGADASLNVDGVNLTSASNIVSNLIQGVTFQLLSPSATDASGNPVPVQVVIGNDNSGVESAINTMVSDYNAAIKAINAQEGNDSSGNPQPLFGSPTVSLLQQQLMSSLNLQSPNGYMDAIPNASDTLNGTLTVQVGSGAAQQFDMSSLSDQTISGLAAAINSADIGVTANVVTSNGESTLTLLSQTAGSAGALTVDSGIVDATNNNTALNYTQTSDVSSLTSLGISMNNDGTISLDTNALDSVLNTDFNSVVGFFQSANSWGMTVANILNQAGTSSSTGILSLAQKANSTMESNLNAEISKEDSLIADQQKSLTAELNQANEILQQLPSQLSGMDMIYSAITGYNQKS